MISDCKSKFFQTIVTAPWVMALVITATALFAPTTASGQVPCEVEIDVRVKCDLNDAFVDDGFVDANQDGTQSCETFTGLNTELEVRVMNVGGQPLENCQYTGVAGLPAVIGTGETFTTGVTTSECSTVAGTTTVSVDCGCDAGLTDAATDSAAISCADCDLSDVELDKTVACGDSQTFGESCISWLPSADTAAEAVTVNFDVTDNTDAGVSLTNCRLDDTNAIIDTTIPGTVGSSGLVHQFSQDCSEALVTAEGAGDMGTVTCDCQLDSDPDIVLPDGAIDTDTAAFDCQAAGLNLSKVCDPQGAGGVAANQNKVTVTVSNVGDGNANTDDAKLINCAVTDTLARDDDVCANASEDVPLANTLDPADFMLDAGESETWMSVIGDNIPAGDAELTLTSCNTASVTCNIDDGSGSPVMEGGDPKEITETADDTCEVQTGCLTHTIGFHSNRSFFVDGTGPITVCGQTLDGFDEVDDLLCDRGQEILNAQCAAAALNIAASNSTEGMGSCMPAADGAAGSLLAVCCTDDSAGGCAPMGGSGLSQSDCIEQVTEFNESADTLACFQLGNGADFCNPGPAGPDSCNGPKKGKGPSGSSSAKGKKK